jgi:hypothetical protein
MVASVNLLRFALTKSGLNEDIMATFKVSNPEQFDFSKPEGWQQYIHRFERFRRAIGLIDKDGTIQVNTLIYCMGSEADEIFSSFQLTDDNKKKVNVVKEKYDGYFIPKRNDIIEGAKFNKRRQNEGESVDHFITHIIRALRLWRYERPANSRPYCCWNT